MKLPDREFTASLGVRTEVPLLVGLMGPSGGGKTYSALRLATGIQSVRGGDIYVVDTEARRALHYADRFKFQHVPFAAPFGSLDYLAVLRYCVGKKAGVVIVDSMSHEHEGEGGYLALHDAELDRIAGDDWDKRKRNNFTAWIKPAANRRALINGLLQMDAAFVFCFRAKEKIKPVKGGEPIELGFMPIAGEEFLFEMTINALLMPHADGIPTWSSEKVGEKLMMKLPAQFRDLFEKPQQISEAHGKAMAEWAKGSESRKEPTLAERVTAAIDYIMKRKTEDGVKAAFAKCADLIAEVQKAEDVESAVRITSARDERLRQIQERQ